MLYRVIADHLGTPRRIVRASDGLIVHKLDVDEWGNVTHEAGSILDLHPFGFAGGLRDRDTELVRFGARDYDPVTGRWTARAPILSIGGQSNLYVYVGNDPVSRADPTALWTVGAFFGGVGDLGWGLGGGVGYWGVNFGVGEGIEFHSHAEYTVPSSSGSLCMQPIMQLRSASVEFRSREDPTVALEKLKACFRPRQELSQSFFKLGMRSWGTSLVGEFVGSSMTLRVVDASAGTLNPIFQGEVLADDGGCRLVGTFRYDRSAVAVAVLVCGCFFAFVAVLIWQITYSLLVTPLVVACLLGITLLRAVPRINSQEETFRKALQSAGFASAELRSRGAD